VACPEGNSALISHQVNIKWLQRSLDGFEKGWQESNERWHLRLPDP